MELPALTKLYYTIGETAKIFQVNPSLIRFWESEFKELKLKKNNRGNRLFTPKDIQTFNKIYTLIKEKGYTLEGAKKELKSKQIKMETTEENNLSVEEIVTKLEQIKQRLLNLKNQQLIICLLIISGSLQLVSCSKDKTPDKIDTELYALATNQNNNVWYKFNNSLLPKSSGSGHPQSALRTRYNSIAQSVLDANGKIIQGSSFPENSLVVKELYDGTKLDRYAILLKRSNDAYADANGWVWGYINADGTVASSAIDKGKSCISCHSQTGNIDYMLMNKFYP